MLGFKNKSDKPFDFVAAGDIVTDAFIELSDAWIENDNPEQSKELCMRFGDKIPYKKVDVIPAVGNSPNAAVSAHRLGLASSLITNLGDDGYGKEMLQQLNKEGLDVRFVKVHKGMGSNYHFVLRWKAERTILVKHHEYKYSFPDIPAPRWLYLSSLAENSLAYHQEITAYLEKHPETKMAFQPGTFQMKLGYEALKAVYKRSDIFFCNKEEAERILGLSAGEDIKSLLQKVKALGPKVVVITDDTRGAYTISEGGEMLHCPRYPDPRPPYEITGAGDAFASTTTVALALGKSLSEALEWGAINASAVLQEIGAQKGLLTRKKLEETLANPGAPFAVEPI